MLLQIVNLSKTFRGPEREVRAVDRISLTIDRGDFIAVQGPSGCGKTTLLLAAGGLLTPDAGGVAIEGQDVYRLSPNRRAALRAEKIGFVFQQFHLAPYLSVRDNVLAPCLARPARDASARADELLAQFGLEPRRNHRPAQLSTGERQRTALARALLNRPRLLLADEPTGNLDAENSEIVLDALDRFARSGGGVLLVTHNRDAMRRARRSIQL